MKNWFERWWQWEAPKTIHKSRWLWFSALCALSMLAAFFALTIDPLAQPVQASPSHAAPSSTQSSIQAPAQSSTIAFATDKYTVNEGIVTGTIVLRITPTSTTPITVTVASASIQAEADKDFRGLRDKLVISPTVAAYTLSLTILDDQLVEGVEQLRLSLGEVRGASLGVISETVVTIVDNDTAYLSIGDVVVDEEEASVTLIITQSTTSTLESLVDVRTIEASATSPEDYAELFTTALITPGSTQTEVTVQLHYDDIPEGSESFLVRLEDATNSQIANMTATVTIEEDENFPAIDLRGEAASELDGQLIFDAMLSAPSMQTITVEYATLDGSATAPDDYLARTGVLTFTPGSVSASVAITLLRDDAHEPEENFFLRLSNPVQAVLATTEAQATIRDGFTGSTFLPGLWR